MSKEIMDKDYYRFGLPHLELMQYQTRFPVGNFLDLGCGSGSDCFFLASLGFSATGVDFSEHAISMAHERLKEESLDIQFLNQDITGFEIEENHYTLISSYYSLMFLNSEQREVLMPEIAAGLKPGGFVVLCVFSTDEPGYIHFEQQGKIKDGSRIMDDVSDGMHFFTKEELLSYFPDFELHHFANQYTLDTGHGEPHYHGSISVVLQKPN